jgi:hypothetical protein
MGKHVLVLAVAALLSASALLAIGILLIGSFGATEGHILGTTALLAGYGLVALPSTVLLDQGRSRSLAAGGVALAAVGASLALAAVWSAGPPEELGRSVGTAAALALASAQGSALAARRQERDPAAVRVLFALSFVLAAFAVSMFAVLLWAQIEHGTYVRLFASLVVLDLLVVALQPILARARPARVPHRLRVVDEFGRTVVMEIEAADLASAAAKAIRMLERDGRRIVRIEVESSAAVRRDPARLRALPDEAGRCRLPHDPRG